MLTKNLMPILLGLSLILWSAFSLESPYTFKGCIVDESGTPLIYADIKNDKGDVFIQSDINGCFAFTAADATLSLSAHYPGYDATAFSLHTDQHQEIILYTIKQLPPVHLSSGRTITATESRGEYLIKGTITDDKKEALIGATIIIKGTDKGTVSDSDGTFMLYTDTPCADITVNYIGFEPINKSGLCDNKKHRIRMKPSEAILEESLTIIGYGEAPKRRKRIASEKATARVLSMDVASSPPPPPPAVMEEAVMYMDAPVEAKSAALDYAESTPTSEHQLPNAGQLTAGEINDFSKWEMWADISQEDLGMYRKSWQQYADHRYTLQLTNQSSGAIVNATIELHDWQGNVLWKARTDVQGRAELWAHYFNEQQKQEAPFKIVGNYNGKTFQINNAKPFNEGVNFHQLTTTCTDQPIVDVAFVVDATGSMGDEILYLQSEMLNVMMRVQDSLKNVDLQLGSVFYRDRQDNYLTQHQVLTPIFNEALDFIKAQSAGGGGDYPEAVDDALQVAIDSLGWRNNATTRILFLVLDAPPHQEAEHIKRLQTSITRLAAQGIHIIPVSCSGVDKNTEYLLRAMALATNGTYTFVTNHSGIGNSHIEPSTDSYDVEFLNDVMVRLTVSMSRIATCGEPVVNNSGIIIEQAVAQERLWSFYPNPTTGPLELKFPTAVAHGELYLADMQGKLLQRLNVGERLSMHLGNYPAGIYLLRHQDSSGQWTQAQVVLSSSRI